MTLEKWLPGGRGKHENHGRDHWLGGGGDDVAGLCFAYDGKTECPLESLPLAECAVWSGHYCEQRVEWRLPLSVHQRDLGGDRPLRHFWAFDARRGFHGQIDARKRLIPDTSRPLTRERGRSDRPAAIGRAHDGLDRPA